MKYVKSILGIRNNVSSDRVRLILCRPRIEYLLWLMLRKNIGKYVSNFGEYPEIYREVDSLYEKWLGKEKDILDKMSRMNSNTLKEEVTLKNLREMSQRCNGDGVRVDEKFKSYYSKLYYKWPDRRDKFMILYLSNCGFFHKRLFPKCKFCGKDNGRTHITNECPKLGTQRKWIQEEIRKKSGKEADDLEQTILKLYFSCYLSEKVTSQVMEQVKKFLTILYIGDGVSNV